MSINGVVSCYFNGQVHADAKCSIYKRGFLDKKSRGISFIPILPKVGSIPLLPRTHLHRLRFTISFD